MSIRGNRCQSGERGSSTPPVLRNFHIYHSSVAGIAFIFVYGIAIIFAAVLVASVLIASVVVVVVVFAAFHFP